MKIVYPIVDIKFQAVKSFDVFSYLKRSDIKWVALKVFKSQQCQKDLFHNFSQSDNPCWNLMTKICFKTSSSCSTHMLSFIMTIL